MVLGLLLVLFVAISGYGNPIEHETFPLDQTLSDLGYSSWQSTAIPMQTQQDFARTISGDTTRAFVTERFEWPFDEFAANTSLTLVAVTLARNAFGQVSGSGHPEKLVVVLDLSDGEARSPKVLVRYRIPDSQSVTRLRFMSEDLLRIETVSTAPRTPSHLQTQYAFFNTSTSKVYRLESKLPYRDIERIKALSDELYIVAHRGLKERAASSHLIISLLTFNPITRSFKTIAALVQNWAIVSPLFSSLVDLPGRDVFQFGPHETKVFFQVNLGGFWQDWVLHRRNDEVFLGKQLPSHAKPKWLVGVLGANPPSDEDLEPLQGFAGGMGGYQHLRKVTAGMIGVAANHPDYQHYLYREGQAPQLLLEDRLVNADYRDGGLIGVTLAGRPNSGRFIIRKVIYDPLSVNRPDSGFDCDQWMY